MLQAQHSGLRILLVEDSQDDADLLLHELCRGGFSLSHRRVETREALEAALAEGGWHAVISDYSLPRLDGDSALAIVKAFDQDLPFILVSANIGEETAVRAMKAGAHDYIMKESLSRLVPVIEREVKEAEMRRRRNCAEEQMRRLSRAVEQTADLVMIADRDGRIQYVNPAFEKATGYSQSEAVGRKSRMLNSGQHQTEFFARLWETILKGEVFQDVFINRKKNGTLYYEEKTITPLKDAQGNVESFVSTGKDITEQVRTKERLQHLSYHDSLTGLPNRALYIDRLTQAISRARWNHRVVAVMFVDLDRFKNINETLGYSAGDRFLQEVSSRLTECLRDGDTVARLGDDEFAVILEDVASDDDIPMVTEKIHDALSKPMVVQGRDLFVSASIGISLYPNDGDDAVTLIKKADTAIHRAKDQGKNTSQYYQTEMSAGAVDWLTMESSLRRALERDEFVLHYQPQVDVENGRTIGLEALIRWEHPELGTVPPGQFIPVLEETGLILPVGEWVMREACTFARAMQQSGFVPLRMSVNVSARQFNDMGFARRVQQIIEETGLPPEQLELEITESTIMRNAQTAINILRDLSGGGIRLAVDDFGTGYSSFSHLRRFPINVLKIDRSFVQDVTENPEDATIASAIIALAHNLGLGVIAEGVETEDQLEFLRRHRCDTYQGFFFSRPLPELLVREFMSGDSRTAVAAKGAVL